VRTRRLGTSGLTVSVVGLGTNQLGGRLDVAGGRAVLDAALDCGITFIDTADSYRESETHIGEILKGRRDDVVLATKFGSSVGGRNGQDWEARGARRYIVRAVESSLRRLQTDHLDLYQLHFPDPVTPIEETLSALTDLVRAGKVRYIGHSNLTGWQAADAEWTARTGGFERFISAQNHYNLLERDVEADLVPALETYGVGLIPYYPLARGILTGKYQRSEALPEGSRLAVQDRGQLLTDAVFDTVDALSEYAAARDISLLDVAIGGLAAQPAVASVICGATSPEQVRANAAAGSWEPTMDDLVALDDLLAGGRAD
jgi:aryl-alcohol dehydrogenase-like predicted oxidoreductase